MYTCIGNHGVLTLLQSTSVSIMELGFKAGKWTAWFYWSWNRVPEGRPWEREPRFQRIYSWFGLWVATRHEYLNRWTQFPDMEMQDFCILNTSMGLLNLSLSPSESKPKCCSFVPTVKDGSGITVVSALQLFYGESWDFWIGDHYNHPRQ